MNLKQYLFTKEDAIVSFNLFCTVCGIGTLGMPANFARAGPVFGTLAMVFMGIANVYASVAISKVMLMAPKSVKTFSDLGQWCMGRGGRYAVIVSHTLVCTIAPTAFLVLGGVLLDKLFPHAFSQTFWIIFMALMVFPVCLTPTLKEGAGAAFAGCVGTIVADVIGIGMLIHGMNGHPSVPSPDVSLSQVATTFGNLALAYGAAIVIPSLQRQHKQPERMPRVVGTTMVIVSLLFIIMAGSGYSAVGCQISGNLLFSVFPDSTGVSALGMKVHFGSAVMAYLFMQLHITIAFSVILHPVFYLAERLVLGMHKSQDDDTDEQLPFVATETPKDSSSTKVSHVPEPTTAESESQDEYSKNSLKYSLVRLVIIAILVAIAIVLQDHFIDLSDFLGASCITCCAIVLPILFYQKKKATTMPMYERVFGLTIVLICTALGGYVSYKSGKNLFAPEDGDGSKFPFCKADHRSELYYIKP